MELISITFTIITAILHGYFLVLEMFLWTTPYGLKTFKMSIDKANSSKVLASNQGVYNGVLALGLILSFFLPEVSGDAIRYYCLAFIIVVSIYGWYTINFKVLLVQGGPAIIALVAGVLHKFSS